MEQTILGGIGISIERVKAFFKEKGIEDRIQEFETSSATVALAVQKQKCSLLRRQNP